MENNMDKVLFRKHINSIPENEEVQESTVIDIVNRRNEAIRGRKNMIAVEWSLEKGFDPTDEKVPASFFIGYMDYSYRKSRQMFQATRDIQNRLRDWGYDVKMDMQSETLVYTDSTGLTHR